MHRLAFIQSNLIPNFLKIKNMIGRKCVRKKIYRLGLDQFIIKFVHKSFHYNVKYFLNKKYVGKNNEYAGNTKAK